MKFHLRSMVWRGWLSAVVALVALAPVCSMAGERAGARVLVLDAESGGGLPDGAVLQLALEHELGVPVKPGRSEPGQPTLSVRAAGEGRARVSLTIDGKTSPGRTLALPAEPLRAAETIALLAANLLHDEAAELLAQLRPPPARTSQPALQVVTADAPIEPPPSATPVAAEVPAAVTPTEHVSSLVLELLPGLTWPGNAAPTRQISIGVAGSFAARVRLLQLAPFVAYSAAPVVGVQAAALTVAGDVRGLQLGAVNLARGRAAWQIGLLNLGSSADVGIGLLSLYRRGRTQFQVMGSPDRQSLIAIKHGSRVVHNVLAIGTQPDARGHWQPVAAYGIGARVSLFERLYVDLDAQQQFSRDADRRFTTRTQLAALAAVRIVGDWRVFAGPTYSVQIERSEALTQADFDGGPRRRSGNFRLLGQLGLSAGVSW
jgi:hypothetical protein